MNSRRYFLFLSVVLAAAGFFDAFSTQFRYTMTTYVRQDFDISFGDLAGLMSWVYLASLLSFIPRVLADVVGRKPMVIVTLIGLCVFQWTLSFAQTPSEYVVLLSLLAIFYKSDVWLIMISEEAPVERRALWSTTTAAMAGFGAATVGLLVRGMSDEASGWREIAAFPIWGVLVALPLLFFVRETEQYKELRAKSRSRFRPALLLAPFRSGVGVSLALITVLKCFFVGGCFVAIAILGSEYLRTGNGFSKEYVGNIVMFDVFASMLGLALSGFFADRFGRRRSFIAFGLLYAVSLAGLALGPRGSFALIACYVLQSYFATSLFGILRVVTVEVLPNDCRATGSAWSDLAMTLCAAQTARLVGGLAKGKFESVGAIDLGTIILSVAMLVPLFLLVYLFLGETRGVRLEDVGRQKPSVPA